jgi:hypothetical protein
MTEPFKNADTRIREAFAALRAEITAIFGEQPDLVDVLGDDFDVADYPARALARLHWEEQAFLDYAKQPASEG